MQAANCHILYAEQPFLPLIAEAFFVFYGPFSLNLFKINTSVFPKIWILVQ